jgi:hypothetical protein
LKPYDIPVWDFNNGGNKKKRREKYQKFALLAHALRSD